MKNENLPEYNFREDALKLGFEIVSISDFFDSVDENQRSKPHIINFYAVIFITSNSGKHHIDFKPYSFKASNLIFIGKNQVHAWDIKNNCKGFIIFFTEHFLFRNQLQFEDLSYSYPYNSNLYHPILETNNEESYSLLFSLLDNEYKNISTSKEEILQCLVRSLILKIQPDEENLDEDFNTKQLFIEFQKLLDQNISHTRNAKDYCQMLNLSYYHLNSICKTYTKKSVKAFIDDIIIINAKRLLSDPTNNTSEVSYGLGFEEPSNFTKFFKSRTGETPKLFKGNISK